MATKIQKSSDLGEIWYYYRHDIVKNWAWLFLAMFWHYSSFIPLVLVLFVWGTFVALCVTVTNIFFIIVLSHSHWYNSPQVGMSLYSDTLFWFRYNLLLLLLLSAAYIVEKQEIPMLLSLVWLTWTWTQDIPHSKEIH